MGVAKRIILGFVVLSFMLVSLAVAGLLISQEAEKNLAKIRNYDEISELARKLRDELDVYSASPDEQVAKRVAARLAELRVKLSASNYSGEIEKKDDSFAELQRADKTKTESLRQLRRRTSEMAAKVSLVAHDASLQASVAIEQTETQDRILTKATSKYNSASAVRRSAIELQRDINRFAVTGAQADEAAVMSKITELEQLTTGLSAQGYEASQMALVEDLVKIELSVIELFDQWILMRQDLFTSSIELSAKELQLLTTAQAMVDGAHQLETKQAAQARGARFLMANTMIDAKTLRQLADTNTDYLNRFTDLRLEMERFFASPEVSHTTSLKKSIDSLESTAKGLAPELAEDEMLLRKQLEEYQRVLRQRNAASERFSENLEKMVQSVNSERDLLMKTISSESRKKTQVTTISGVLAVVIGVLMATMIVQSVSKPLVRLTAQMRGIADGQLDILLSDSVRKDELGDMARAIEVFRDQGIAKQDLERERRTTHLEQRRVMDKLANSLMGIADGDLSQSLDVSFASGYDQLEEDFNKAIGNLVVLVASISHSTDQVRNNTDEISASANDLGRRTERSAAAIEEAVIAVGDLTNSVKNAEITTRDTEGHVEKMRLQATDAKSIVNSTISAFGNVEESSRKLSNITSLIEDIAFQTNLLALNAGVEAARAGEAGRGFAVVASEVRALAQRCSDAVQEANGLIGSSDEHVNDAAELVETAGQKITAIVESMEEISQRASELSQSSQGQSRKIVDLNNSLSQLDRTAQENAAMFEQTVAATSGLLSETTALSEQVAKFRIPISEQTISETYVSAA